MNFERLAERRAADAARRRAVRDAYAGWLAQGDTPWFVTWCYADHAPSPGRLRRDLKHWRNRVHRKLLGARWSTEKKRGRHMRGLYAVEGINAFNAHAHALVSFEADDPDGFVRICDAEWRAIANGNVVVRPSDPANHSKYLVKCLNDPRCEELLGFLDDL